MFFGLLLVINIRLFDVYFKGFIMKVISEDNKELNATVSITTLDGVFGLVLESRGGAKGKSNERNSDYTIALDAILSRLQICNVEYIEVTLVSSKSINTWSARERVLIIDGETQIDIRNYDILTLRRKITHALQSFKSNINAKGGNGTKRILINTSLNSSEWLSIIHGDSMETKIGFNIDEIDAKREVANRLVSIRRGQASFRKNLLLAYEGRCAISGTMVVETLQAAHIYPYMGQATNEVSNGLLLRADLHLLFDMGLIYLNNNFTVSVSEKLNKSEYYFYDGKKIYLPAIKHQQPSQLALKERSRLFNV
ncbi:HNH endonuclease [Klebsiella variicola]|nr:HNH endonuclease [Klebsiella variicola]PXL23589.1 HNH endonuclease [Klebsiella variicola]PXL29841.1 HNH endonuclease [Klebsiella variicola]